MAVIAECPRCESPIEVTDMPTDAAQIAYIGSQLIGHVFVMDTMIHHPAFEHLAGEYAQRVERMKHTMSEWVHDLQDWSDSATEEEDDPS